MADELSNPIKFSYSKGNVTIKSPQAPTTVTVTGTKVIDGTVQVNITDTTIDKGSIATIGWVVMQNLDPTNFVTVGSDGTNYPIKLKPNEPPVTMRWNGSAVHAIADTGICEMYRAFLPD